MEYIIRSDQWKWIIIAIILLSSIAIQSNLFLNSDISWLLDIVHRWFQGGNYQQNFFENNPPMILYLYAFPEWISEKMNFNHIIVIRVFTYLLSILSLALSCKIVNKIFKDNDGLTKTSFLIGLTFCYWLLPVYEFGQREHWMIMLVMPYLLLAVLRCKGEAVFSKFSVLIGVLAGIGFALKPHFLLTFVFIEIYLIIKTQKLSTWFRSEAVIVVFIVLAYLTSIFLFMPKYITAVLPYVWNFYLNTVKESFFELVVNSIGITWLAAVIFYFVLRKKIIDSDVYAIMVIANIGFMLVYLLQGRSWYYHAIPMFTISILLLLLFCARCIQKINSLPSASFKYYWINLYLIISIIVLFPLFFIYRLTTFNVNKKNSQQSYINQLIQFVKNYPVKGSIYFFSASVVPSSTVVDYARVTSASRFPSFWMLPGIIKIQHSKLNDNKLKMIDDANYFITQAVVEDFERNSPQLVFVDSLKYPSNFGTYPFDFIKYFSQDPKFKRIWSNYRYLEHINIYSVYRKGG